MKGLALGRPRKLEKDSYNIYAVAGFHGGNPEKAASHFKQLTENHCAGTPPKTYQLTRQKGSPPSSLKFNPILPQTNIIKHA